MTQELEQRFCAARRDYIASRFSRMNPRQLEAVLTTEGPLLLLAGAGSGKTTVLIHRIANLIRYGCASDSTEVPPDAVPEDIDFLEEQAKYQTEEGVQRADALCALRPAAPWSILAITFTNKAANELRERLTDLLGPEANDVWAMTFHSACCRILRREIERLGYDRSFTIYDTADSERVMKDLLRERGLDEKTFPPRAVLTQISRLKDQMQTPEEFLASVNSDYRLKCIGQLYASYQRRLQEANAVDFDDIILLTVRLLQEYEDVRDHYQRKFRYVLIDEYQDTNHLQYLLASLLAGRHENICVVGDDDQSIYRFRGATIENILNFENEYQGARLIRLEQNYRSTQSILDAANAVIANNHSRKGKKLWTENGQGDRVRIYEASDGVEEANYVANRILTDSHGRNYGDFAVLYRMNAQSNALEYAFKRNGIPYRIIGGTRFFDRAEVKDMLAYLCSSTTVRTICACAASSISRRAASAAKRSRSSSARARRRAARCIPCFAMPAPIPRWSGPRGSCSSSRSSSNRAQSFPARCRCRNSTTSCSSARATPPCSSRRAMWRAAPGWRTCASCVPPS